MPGSVVQIDHEHGAFDAADLCRSRYSSPNSARGTCYAAGNEHRYEPDVGAHIAYQRDDHGQHRDRGVEFMGLYWRPSNYLLIGFVFLGCVELGAQRTLTAQSDGVFVEISPPAATSWVTPAPGALRERFVRIDLDRLDAARASVGEASAGGSPTLPLNLFDDARFAARAEHTGPTATGYTLSGSLGGAGGTVTLVVNGDLVAGSVRAPGATYEIRSLGAGVHVIRQVDPTALQLPRDDAVFPPTSPRPRGPAGAQPIRPPDPSASRSPAAAAPPPAEDGSRIDILIVYTPKAKADHGGAEPIRALIDLLFAETNQAYAASGVRQRVNLAHVAQVNYVERGVDSVTILRHLTDPNPDYSGRLGFR